MTSERSTSLGGKGWWFRRVVNFENPNLRVGMPVFSIHGNHDYPHGEKSLSAMNVPSASGLINYFGKKVR